jgi:hypothetical protein
MGNPRASVSKQRRVTRYSIVSEVQTHVHLQTFKLKIPRIIKRWKDKSTNICNIDASLVQLLCFLSTTSTSKRSASAFSSGGAVHAPTILMLGYGIKLSFGRMFRFVLSLSLLTRLLLAREVSVCLSLSLLTRLVFGREQLASLHYHWRFGATKGTIFLSAVTLSWHHLPSAALHPAS